MNRVEEEIRRAMEEGKFDNLPGKGKPLRLEENPWEDPEWRSAYHLLKSNGFTLPWIEIRREIEAELERAESELIRAGQWRQQAVSSGKAQTLIEQEWQRSLTTFEKKIEELNRRILSYNLIVPHEQFQIRNINPQAQIQAIFPVKS